VIRILLLATALAAATAPANASRTAPHALTSSLSVTGEIQRLGPSRIAVGKLGCAIPAKLTASAGRFVIGDPVRITCLNGTLRSVRYSPEVATAQTSKVGGGNAPTTVTSPLPIDPSKGTSLAYSVGTIFLGAGPTGDSSSATGTISDISDGSLTAGGLTCSFNTFLDTFFGQVAQVGDDVTLTCTGGTLVHLASVGTIHRSS
jgi:hypothetical protein